MYSLHENIQIVFKERDKKEVVHVGRGLSAKENLEDKQLLYQLKVPRLKFGTRVAFLLHVFITLMGLGITRMCPTFQFFAFPYSS